jgi:hypothetical protein
VTKRMSKRIKSKNTERGKPGVIMVSYCPECQPQADPRFTNKCVVVSGLRTGNCKAGHSWPLVKGEVSFA